MIASFLKRLWAGDKAPAEPLLSPQLAAATLMVEAALADGVYADIESHAIQQTLEEAFQLTPEAASKLREQAEQEAEKAVDAHRFTRQIKRLGEAERVKIIEGLYVIALADGERCKFEEAFVRHIASLLHIEDVVRAQARQRAQARNSLSN